MARPRQFTDDEILAEARRCFLEHGATVSTAHIAGEIGLSQAALFKRFQTKENLLIQAMAPSAEPEWMKRVALGPSDAPIEEQLVAIGLDALAFFRGLMPRMFVLKSAGIEPTELLSRFDLPPPIRAIRLLGAFLEQAEARGLARAEQPAALAMQIMGSLHVRVYFGHMFQLPSSPEEDEAYVRAAMRHLCHGIAPLGER